MCDKFIYKWKLPSTHGCMAAGSMSIITLRAWRVLRMLSEFNLIFFFLEFVVVDDLKRSNLGSSCKDGQDTSIGVLCLY